MEVGIIYKELSYKLNGILYAVHNELKRFAKEKQYGDLLAEKLAQNGVEFKRELQLGSSGNTVDFIVDNKIVVELKAKPMVSKDDYYQLQRYLQASNFRLGLLVNFRSKFLKPIRIVRIENKK